MFHVKFKHYIGNNTYLDIYAKATDVTAYGAINLKLKIKNKYGEQSKIDEFILEDIEERIMQEMLEMKYENEIVYEI